MTERDDDDNALADGATGFGAMTYRSTTALVVVDMQNDFADPSGSLYVAGGDLTVDANNREIAAAVAAGCTVVYTQDWHPPITAHFDTHGGIWPVHCVRDTWGAALHPQLEVAGSVVFKGTGGEDGYSGFTMRDPVSGEQTPTELPALLRQHGVTEVVVTGLALDVCVKATALDSLAAGYPTVIVADATAPVDLRSGDGYRAIAELVKAGAVIR